MKRRGPTRLRARRKLMAEGRSQLNYEQKYDKEDWERKVVAGIVAGDVYQRTSAPDSRDYLRNPTWWGGRTWYWGDKFHIRLPVTQALPPWAWIVMFWSVAFFTTFLVVMILLTA